MQFDHFEYFNLLWVLLPFLTIYIWYIFWRVDAIGKFGSKSLFGRLAPMQSNAKHYLKFVLLFLVFISLAVALANPKIGTHFETVKREGVDVMIAIDVSRSMNAEDIQPSRMLKARQFVSNLINKMSNDRIGLIVFAGNAYLQMPLTVDYSATKMFLKQVNTDLVPTQGTAIADAVDLAKRSFPDKNNTQKVLILISDGESHDDSADEAINTAKKNGIKVIAVGVGSKKGAPIPVGRKGDFKKDSDGNIVMTKLNEEMLKDLVSDANGKYFHINEQNIVGDILAELASLDGTVFEEKVITDYKQHFQLFIGIALFLLLTEFVLSFRKSKFGFNVFNKKDV